MDSSMMLAKFGYGTNQVIAVSVSTDEFNGQFGKGSVH